MTWYAEQKVFDGRWVPIKSAIYPDKGTGESARREYRNIKELTEEEAKWPLESLREMFNPSEGGIAFKSARK